MIARTLTEWRELRHGSGAGEIPEPLAARLAAVAAASPLSGRGGEGVLEHRRHSLRARGVVGIVVADGAVLEILPKIDSAGSDAAVRDRLVHMIAVALDLRVEAGEIAGHGEQRDTLLEHFDAMLLHYGAETGVRMARKHVGWYARGFPGAAEFRARAMTMTDPQAIRDAIRGAWDPALGRLAA